MHCEGQKSAFKARGGKDGALRNVKWPRQLWLLVGYLFTIKRSALVISRLTPAALLPVSCLSGTTFSSSRKLFRILFWLGFVFQLTGTLEFVKSLSLPLWNPHKCLQPHPSSLNMEGEGTENLSLRNDSLPSSMFISRKMCTLSYRNSLKTAEITATV